MNEGLTDGLPAADASAIGTERMAPKVMQKKLGAEIRRIRNARGWTLAKLSDTSGISLGYLSQIELGKNSASIGILNTIATALKVHLGDVFTAVEGPAEGQPQDNGNGQEPVPGKSVEEYVGLYSI